jgi:AraC-like DNA-binding protein
MPTNLMDRAIEPAIAPDALVVSASLGDVAIVNVLAESSQRLDRLSAFAAAHSEGFLLVVVEFGAISVIQRNVRRQADETQYALLDCSAPITFEGAGERRLLGVFIPGFLLRARLRNLPMTIGQPKPCVGSPWRIALNLLRMLANEVRHIPPAMAYGYASQLAELVSVAIEADTQGSAEFSSRAALFRRCAAYVKSHLSDCALDPNMIADAMGISVRYLHKIFHERGESVCEYLRLARLEASRLELSEPRGASVQIREIARRVGFRSQAHFAAAFKSRYGISASEWRRSSARRIVAAEAA